MAALIPDERCFIYVPLIFFLQMKMEQALSGTNAATYKVMEPHCNKICLCLEFSESHVVN